MTQHTDRSTDHSPHRPASPFTAAAVVVAALISTCCLVHFRNGPASSGLLLLASMAASAAVAFFPGLTGTLPRWAWDGLLVAVAVLYGTLTLWGDAQTYPQYTAFADTYAFYLFACFGAATLLVVRTQTARAAVVWGILMTLATAGMMTETVRSVPRPGIDVYTFETEACRALLAGKNPYAIAMPNVYGEHTPFYDPAEITHGPHSLVLRGYSYPPLTLYLLLPAYAAGVDVRYVLVAALLLTGLLVLAIDPTPVGGVLAVVTLFGPFNLEMIGACWTEPFTVAAFALTVWCALRRPAWCAWAFGLFLATKQYSLFYLPAAVLLVPRPWTWRNVGAFVAKAAGVAIVLTLPLVAWDWRAYYHSTVAYLANARPRPDSLNVATVVFHAWWSPLPVWLAYAATGGAYLLCYRLLRPSATAFCLAAGVAGMLVFALNKFAFSNYYFLPATAFVLAAAAQHSGRDRTHSVMSASPETR